MEPQNATLQAASDNANAFGGKIKMAVSGHIHAFQAFTYERAVSEPNNTSPPSQLVVGNGGVELYQFKLYANGEKPPENCDLDPTPPIDQLVGCYGSDPKEPGETCPTTDPGTVPDSTECHKGSNPDAADFSTKGFSATYTEDGATKTYRKTIPTGPGIIGGPPGCLSPSPYTKQGQEAWANKPAQPENRTIGDAAQALFPELAKSYIRVKTACVVQNWGFGLMNVSDKTFNLMNASGSETLAECKFAAAAAAAPPAVSCS